jgi:hypothetical protein
MDTAMRKQALETTMEQVYQRPERRHLTELALEAVWIADEQTELDAEHARVLSRFGFGSGELLLGRPH